MSEVPLYKRLDHRPQLLRCYFRVFHDGFLKVVLCLGDAESVDVFMGGGRFDEPLDERKIDTG